MNLQKITAWSACGMAACICVLLQAILQGASVLAADNDQWEALLRMQLETEKKCQFQRIVSMRQLPVPGLDALEGRVRCTDGREFDFSRPKPHQKFEIHLCAPAVC